MTVMPGCRFYTYSNLSLTDLHTGNCAKCLLQYENYTTFSAKIKQNMRIAKKKVKRIKKLVVFKIMGKHNQKVEIRKNFRYTEISSFSFKVKMKRIV